MDSQGSHEGSSRGTQGLDLLSTLSKEYRQHRNDNNNQALSPKSLRRSFQIGKLQQGRFSSDMQLYRIEGDDKVRLFQCPVLDCQKKFYQSGNLKAHLRTHTGERPYECPIHGCSSKFTALNSVKRHFARFHLHLGIWESFYKKSSNPSTGVNEPRQTIQPDERENLPPLRHHNHLSPKIQANHRFHQQPQQAQPQPQHQHQLPTKSQLQSQQQQQTTEGRLLPNISNLLNMSDHPSSPSPSPSSSASSSSYSSPKLQYLNYKDSGPSLLLSLQNSHHHAHQTQNQNYHSFPDYFRFPSHINHSSTTTVVQERPTLPSLMSIPLVENTMDGMKGRNLLFSSNC